jgi:hypothetical protein
LLKIFEAQLKTGLERLRAFNRREGRGAGVEI